MKFQHSKCKYFLESNLFLHSFKKLALKNHPLKHPDNMQIHLEKFHKICEAYEVLSSRKLHFEK